MQEANDVGSAPDLGDEELTLLLVDDVEQLLDDVVGVLILHHDLQRSRPIASHLQNFFDHHLAIVLVPVLHAHLAPISSDVHHIDHTMITRMRHHTSEKKVGEEVPARKRTEYIFLPRSKQTCAAKAVGADLATCGEWALCLGAYHARAHVG